MQQRGRARMGMHLSGGICIIMHIGGRSLERNPWHLGSGQAPCEGT